VRVLRHDADLAAVLPRIHLCDVLPIHQDLHSSQSGTFAVETSDWEEMTVALFNPRASDHRVWTHNTGAQAWTCSHVHVAILSTLRRQWTETHRARVGVVQALQQRHESGLAAAGQAYQRHQPPRPQRQTHLIIHMR
jgi:hypothetical protein